MFDELLKPLLVIKLWKGVKGYSVKCPLCNPVEDK